MEGNDSPATGATRPEGPRGRLVEAALIGLLALTLNLAGNGRMSLWDRDEPRYAGCTREMRASGDYVHPTFNAEPRYHKPILTYWLMLAGTALGGDNPFGARLVSAFLGMGTVLLVWTLGRRMFGPRAGRLAALVLATAPIMVAESKLATTDATLMFFLTACQLALWELSRAPSRAWAGLFWVALALATLTKGPVGPVLIGLAGLVSLAWGGPSSCWGRLQWTWGPAAFVAITAPWYVAIGIISHGEFFRVSMGKHVVHRMTTGMETHGGFPGYYVVGTLLTFYPWSALLPAALLGSWARRRSNPALGFAAGWMVGPLILLEVIRTKLIHYYLPAYAGAALLVAWAATTIADSGLDLRRWPLGRVALGLLGGLGVAMAVGLAAVGVTVGGGMRGPSLVLAALIGVGTAYAIARFHAGATGRAVHALVGLWAVVLLVAGSWALPALEPYRLSPMVARWFRQAHETDGARPVMASYQAPGVVYNYGSPVSVLETRAWLADVLRRDGAVASALTDKELALLARDPSWTIETRGSIRGLDVERAALRTLRLVVIRPADAPAGSGLARGGQQPDVK